MIGLNQLDGEVIGGIMHIINHGVFKTLLFLSAGVIINVYKQRDVTKIRGVLKTHPILSLFMIIGILSITGVPFLNGYVSKSLIKYSINSYNLTYLMYFIDILTIAYFIKLSQIFLPYKVNTGNNIRIGIYKLIPIFVLSAACIILGNFYIPIYNLFTDYSIRNIEAVNYFEWIILGLKVLTAYIIYKIIIKKDYRAVEKLRNLKISFSTTNFLFVVFLTMMLLWKM
jgi:multicomponent Na+:H+ antiporter subunit D